MLTASNAERAIPGAEMVTAAFAQKVLTAVEYAGNPTNNVTPEFRGQWCFDTSNEAYYIACSDTDSSKWKKLTP